MTTPTEKETILNLISELSHYGLVKRRDGDPVPSGFCRVFDTGGEERPRVKGAIRAFLQTHGVEGASRYAGGVELHPLRSGQTLTVVRLGYEAGELCRFVRVELG